MDPLEPYAQKGMTWARAMQHAEKLAGEAAQQVARDPAARPVGVIMTPDCNEIRDTLEGMLKDGRAKPNDWVPLLVDRSEALRILRSTGTQTMDWVLPERDSQTVDRMLPIIVLTPFGFRFGGAPYTVPGMKRSTSRAQCTVHAMVLCVLSFRQSNTGRWCVIGVHDRVKVAQLPCIHTFAVFASLGDFVGRTKFELRVRGEVDVLCRIGAEACLFEEIGTLDIGVPFPQLRFEQAGTYRVELLFGGKVIATRPMTVEVATP